jgi:preprotein translocase subunit SecF
MLIMKYRPLFFLISLFFLVPSIISLTLYGLKPSIDFTGGSMLEIRVSEEVSLERDQVREAVGDLYDVQNVQQVGPGQYSIDGNFVTNEVKENVLGKLREQFGEVEEVRFDTVGATVSAELIRKTAAAVLLVAGLIAVYVWHQFDELKYGVCAILAMVHDSVILLGVFSILGHFLGVEVDILFVTALLTTLSFSIHDTIVVFDRIRELYRKNRRVPYEALVNTAVIETLSRSINNSVTIIIMLLALVLLGGETIRWFALALLVGAVTGTYSSTFTAAPLLLLWEDIVAKRRELKRNRR